MKAIAMQNDEYPKNNLPECLCPHANERKDTQAKFVFSLKIINTTNQTFLLPPPLIYSIPLHITNFKTI